MTGLPGQSPARDSMGSHGADKGRPAVLCSGERSESKCGRRLHTLQLQGATPGRPGPSHSEKENQGRLYSPLSSHSRLL